MGADRGGWRPQLSVLNCNRQKIWVLLTDPKQATFHYLERKVTKEKLIYDIESQKFIPFIENEHTPNW